MCTDRQADKQTNPDDTLPDCLNVVQCSYYFQYYYCSLFSLHTKIFIC